MVRSIFSKMFSKIFGIRKKLCIGPQNACKKKKMSSKNNHSSYKKMTFKIKGILMHGATKETANIVRLCLFLYFVAFRRKNSF